MIQRNLIVNFAYKLDDREATEKLAENLAESILDGNREAVLKTDWRSGGTD